jgi:hypothetical protein
MKQRTLIAVQKVFLYVSVIFRQLRQTNETDTGRRTNPEFILSVDRTVGLLIDSWFEAVIFGRKFKYIYSFLEKESHDTIF